MSFGDTAKSSSVKNIDIGFLSDQAFHPVDSNNFKRVIDFGIALFSIILLSPILAAIALMVTWSTGSHCIYKHRRVGRNGLPFACFKFRSMLHDSETILRDHLSTVPDAAREWQATHKLTNDPRVTRLGRFLRATSLDELPQLFNVLRGDMSCVGPRPIVFAELERYGPSASVYFKARPGLTGLWQVSGRSRLSYADRVALDRHYVLNRSLLVDLKILARTIPAVMRLSQTS